MRLSQIIHDVTPVSIRRQSHCQTNFLTHRAFYRVLSGSCACFRIGSGVFRHIVFSHMFLKFFRFLINFLRKMFNPPSYIEIYIRMSHRRGLSNTVISVFLVIGCFFLRQRSAESGTPPAGLQPHDGFDTLSVSWCCCCPESSVGRRQRLDSTKTKGKLMDVTTPQSLTCVEIRC